MALSHSPWPNQISVGSLRTSWCEAKYEIKAKMDRFTAEKKCVQARQRVST